MTVLELLGIKHPIIQAPMAGVTTPEFVAASAEAGCLVRSEPGIYQRSRHGMSFAR